MDEENKCFSNVLVEIDPICNNLCDCNSRKWHEDFGMLNFFILTSDDVIYHRRKEELLNKGGHDNVRMHGFEMNHTLLRENKVVDEHR